MLSSVNEIVNEKWEVLQEGVTFEAVTFLESGVLAVESRA